MFIEQNFPGYEISSCQELNSVSREILKKIPTGVLSAPYKVLGL